MRRHIDFSLTGELPDAPMAMPKQVLERPNAWRSLLRFFQFAPARS